MGGGYSVLLSISQKYYRLIVVFSINLASNCALSKYELFRTLDLYI